MKNPEPSENLKRYIAAYRTHSSHVELESIQAVLKGRSVLSPKNWYHSHLTGIITSSCIVGAAVLCYFLLSAPPTGTKKPANTSSQLISKQLTNTNRVFAPSPATPFRVTRRAYSVSADLDAAVRAEFGPDYVLADWSDVKTYCATHSVDSLIAMTGWPLSVASATPDDVMENAKDKTVDFFVNYNRKRFWINNDPTWHFFATNWQHHPPSNWKILDQIDSNFLILGAWADMKCRILVERKQVFH